MVNGREPEGYMGGNQGSQTTSSKALGLALSLFLKLAGCWKIKNLKIKVGQN